MHILLFQFSVLICDILIKILGTSEGTDKYEQSAMPEDKNTPPSLSLSPSSLDICQLKEPDDVMEHDYDAWREHTQIGDLNTPYKKPPHIKPRIKSAPRIRQIFWCDFPHDSILPEFWKK